MGRDRGLLYRAIGARVHSIFKDSSGALDSISLMGSDGGGLGHYRAKIGTLGFCNTSTSRRLFGFTSVVWRES